MPLFSHEPAALSFSTGALTGAWRTMADDFMASPEGRAIAARCSGRTDVFPTRPFRALEETPLESVRVVILGQDPYHTRGKAEGLAFSVPEGEKIPPSLRNIFKEIEAEFGGPRRCTTSLLDWARSGVLLLNTILTVEEGRPLSHAKLGWEAFTGAVVRRVAETSPHAVFLLWGEPAQRFARGIPEGRHLVLTASHPSPLSASRGKVPFLGCGHFRKANDALLARGLEPVSWRGF